MLRRVAIAGIVLLMILNSLGGAMGSEFKEVKDKHGHFKGNVFNNGHIIVKIEKDYAVMKDSESKEILVEKAYPVVQIKRGGKWGAVEFEEKFMEKSSHNGWHVVAVGMVHHGDIEIRGFLEYYQKEKFKEGEPLYPLLLLYFNRSVEYKVIWRYEGIVTNYFEVIDNGTGYTRPPFKEGHERWVIYNGTVHGTVEFEDEQDIVKTWKNNELLFGLNWEKEKMRFKKLIIHAEDNVSMEIAEEPGRGLRYEDTGGFVVSYTPPIPDHGGGGSGDDSDGDGLSDSQEQTGWWIWLCTSGTTWHHIKVWSDPHYKDTDNDGVNDKVEYDHGTNPQDEDTDNDGLSDRQEIYYYGTYAYTWDSDENEVSDNDEFYNWLFMLYLDGDNNLESEIEDIMWQITMGLNAAGSVSQVKQVIHVVAQYDGRNWGNSARYEIKANTLEWEKVKVEDLGEVAMSLPGTLSGFVNWAVDRIWQPNRRALIIVDHGGGWQGVCWDDSISLDNFTDMQELKQAFENMKVHIDLVEFSACLMQMSEVLYQLRGYADLIVGSEETGWLSEWQYNNLFNHLAAIYAARGIPIHPEDLANEICLTYSPQVDNYTISSVKMSKVNSELISQINNFAQKLINEINNGMGEEIQSIISQTLHMHVPTKDGDFYNHSYRDLYDFAKRIRNNFSANSSVGRAAWNVMSAIEEAVIYERYSDKDYHGISIFLPDEVWWKNYTKEIKLYDRGVNWASTDIQIYHENKRPSANVGGIKNSNEHIYLPHNWDGDGYPWGYSWTHKEGYRTIVHELGHYALFLYDEYIDAYGREYPRVHDDATGYDIPQGPHSFMNFQYKYSEMTSEYNYTHWSPPSGYKTTMQRYINQESCWETFFRMYNSVNGEYKKVIEFDLNGDSIADSAFWDSYIPKPGPVWDFSDITEVLIYDF